ncbi:MAG: hypothetical protein KGN84_16850 [Acidobacteriota bacterium]|nr:hypothetical protein [Acidobacteriota bacterium]
MKNAFSRMGWTCASMIVGGALLAGSMFAATVTPVSVDLPHDVTVGSVVLPTGHYTMSSIEMGGGQIFIVRSDDGKTATLPAQAVASGDSNARTQVVLSKDGDTWRFDRLTVAGEGQTYQFNGGK